jgi:hypothetical protein
MKNKVCSKCKKLKPLTDFSPDKRAPDGRVWRCRSCVAEYKRSRTHQEIVAFDYYE